MITGVLVPRWAVKKSGNVTHARWTNTQSRVLRDYCSTTSPSFEMERIVGFIVHVYGPVLMTTHRDHRFRFGPYHLLMEIKAAKAYCTPKELEVVEPIIQFNGYMGHPENVLLALLCSPDKEERTIAVERIVDIREQEKLVRPNWGKFGVRPFKVAFILTLLLVNNCLLIYILA